MKRSAKKHNPEKNALETISLKLPSGLLRALNQAVAAEDTDRSKFIRRAIRTQVASADIKPHESSAS